jgi:hypothetical protein
MRGTASCGCVRGGKRRTDQRYPHRTNREYDHAVDDRGATTVSVTPEDNTQSTDSAANFVDSDLGTVSFATASTGSRDTYGEPLECRVAV